MNTASDPKANGWPAIKALIDGQMGDDAPKFYAWCVAASDNCLHDRPQHWKADELDGSRESLSAALKNAAVAEFATLQREKAGKLSVTTEGKDEITPSGLSSGDVPIVSLDQDVHEPVDTDRCIPAADQVHALLPLDIAEGVKKVILPCFSETLKKEAPEHSGLLQAKSVGTEQFDGEIKPVHSGQ